MLLQERTAIKRNESLLAREMSCGFIEVEENLIKYCRFVKSREYGYKLYFPASKYDNQDLPWVTPR